MISQTQTIHQKVPNELLELKILDKPNIKENKDVINAYIELFENYKACEIKLIQIKELNQ
ncbi:hypothetical protein [Campylobacter sp. US33a]|uniref:hypothetical protein n=1 Tax=Campylobacter sp. US33a TaxID=2498120 RepID=UPI0010682D02|nr:hypothetical protein [Campylobacter sp. US33a]TEY00214.1 hypothetical protein ELQ16_09595 [Campylobacter sp. US33a]